MDQIQIRKVTFGGYDRDDVEQALTELRHEREQAVAERERERDAVVEENQVLLTRLDGLTRLQDENAVLRRTVNRKDEELESLRQENAWSASQLESLRAEMKANGTEELERLRLAQTELEQSLAQMRQQAEELQRARTQDAERITRLEQENELLRGQVEQYARDSHAYDLLRSSLGQIELDARVRARSLVDEGSMRASQLLDEARDRRAELDSQYGQLRGELSAALGNIAEQLLRLHAQVCEAGEALPPLESVQLRLEEEPERAG